MDFADLHLHTHHSDGSDTPAEVAARAAKLGFAGIAITDHDTVGGIAEGARAAQDLGLAFLNGTEISARFERMEIHVTGLGIDTGCTALLDALARLRDARAERAHAMMELLHEAGIPIDREAVAARAGGGAMGRMHIAIQLRKMGVTRGTQEGFDRFLKPGRPAYVPKSALPVAEAIDCIHAARGLAIVAHPGLSKSLRNRLDALLELPFDGIEAYHVSHSPGQVDDFLGIARGRGLLIAGGSDCHGTVKGAPEMGKVHVPFAHFEALRAKQHRAQAQG